MAFVLSAVAPVTVVRVVVVRMTVEVYGTGNNSKPHAS